MRRFLLFGLLVLLPAVSVAQVAPVKKAVELSTDSSARATASTTSRIIPLAELGKPLRRTDDGTPLPGYQSEQGQRKIPSRVQLTGDTSKLQQLQRTPLYHKYLNFEVVKVMVGIGWQAPDPVGSPYPWSLPKFYATDTTRASIKQKGVVATRVQILYPYAISRRFLKLAVGVTYGYSLFSLREAKIKFPDAQNEFVSVSRDSNIRSTTVRSHSIGIVALRIIRLPGALHNVTLLPGISGEYNTYNQLKIRPVDGPVDKKSVSKYVRRLSIPAHVQIGWSRSQFLSFGLFATYDLLPRFKEPKLSGMHQMVAGGSLGLIL